jgi:hypothetical protein
VLRTGLARSVKRVLGDFDFCYYIGFAISAKAFIRFLLLGWLDGLGVVVGWYTYG